MKLVKSNISNKSNTYTAIKKYGFTFKKSLGQNFIIDPNILDKIVEKADLDKDTGVIEIGPGIGALTQKLAESAGKVVAIEIDQRLIPILNESLAENDNVVVINGDILKLPLDRIIEEQLDGYKAIKVVANLPYYITTPIIMKLLEDKLKLGLIMVMIQKEVAERISAAPGSKDYGSLTLAIEYYAKADIAFSVPRKVFLPEPNVDSAVLQLQIRDNPPYKADDEEFLFKVIRASFAQRRKTIYNNLTNNLVGKDQKEEVLRILELLNIDQKRRAETLTLKEFVELSNYLLKL